MTLIEIELDENHILYGKVEKYDTSFSHEFGVKKQTDIEVTDLWIVTFIRNVDTKVIPTNERDIEYFKNLILEKFYELSA